jgi:hypothetical protein
MGMGAR